MLGLPVTPAEQQVYAAAYGVAFVTEQRDFGSWLLRAKVAAGFDYESLQESNATADAELPLMFVDVFTAEERERILQHARLAAILNARGAVNCYRADHPAEPLDAGDK